MLPLIEGIFNGLSIGSVLLIAALGLAVVFGLMGVINLAHGELIMLGAYSTFVVQNVFKGFGESWFNLYIFFALPIAFLVAAIAGLILERGVIRHLYGRPLETLLATWGVSLILRQFVRSVSWSLVFGITVFWLRRFVVLFLRYILIFLLVNIFLRIFRKVFKLKLDLKKIQDWLLKVTLPLAFFLAFGTIFVTNQTGNEALNKPWFSARNIDVTAPPWLQEGFEIGKEQTIYIPYSRVFIIILTIICVAGTYWFLNKSNWGLRIRAVTQNRTMSACLGIPTQKVDALTFAIGSGLAGIAGCAITLLGSVGPNTGQNYIVDTFMVVVVGGVGNLFGTILAAFAIGIINYLIGSGTFALLFASVDSLQPLTDFFNFFATTSMSKVMVFALIILFLQIKPAGIFPQKGRTAEL